MQSVGLFYSKYSVSKHKTKQDNTMQKQELVMFPESKPLLQSLVERHRGQSEGIKIIWEEAKAVFLTREKAVPLPAGTGTLPK